MVLLCEELVDECPADLAAAQEHEVESVGGISTGVLAVQVEGVVQGADGIGGLGLADGQGDVELGGALCDGQDVDAGATEGGEDLASHAGDVGHAQADAGDQAHPGGDHDLLDVAVGEVGAELGLERGGGIGGICGGDHDGDAGLGA